MLCACDSLSVPVTACLSLCCLTRADTLAQASAASQHDSHKRQALVLLNLAAVEVTSIMAPPSTDLSTMNKQTVRFTTWVARVAYSHAYSYTFDSKGSGQRITSHKLECRLVGNSQKDYVLAVLKGTPSEVESAKKKCLNGSVWELSNVKFEQNATPAFISSPLKLSVDIKTSTVNLNKNADLEKQLVQSPVPPRTVAESSQITTTRHEDLLAVVTKVDPLRLTKRGEVLDVTVMDGSEDTEGPYA